MSFIIDRLKTNTSLSKIIPCRRSYPANRDDSLTRNLFAHSGRQWLKLFRSPPTNTRLFAHDSRALFDRLSGAIERTIHIKMCLSRMIDGSVFFFFNIWTSPTRILFLIPRAQYMHSRTRRFAISLFARMNRQPFKRPWWILENELK